MYFICVSSLTPTSQRPELPRKNLLTQAILYGDRTRRTIIFNGTFDNESAGIPASESIQDHNEDIDYDFLEERDRLFPDRHRVQQALQCSPYTEVVWPIIWIASSCIQNGWFKRHSMETRKKEIEHVRYCTCKLLSKTSENEIVTPEEIAMHSLGPESLLGKYMTLELKLDKKVYHQFMTTFLIQAAYRVSTTEPFRRDSLLHVWPCWRSRFKEC